ncbi:MAG: hypothetical protein KF868_14260 [Acidobacteria bacterium]|nr:hypothetical protein [Acidobacteriota bacterium]
MYTLKPLSPEAVLQALEKAHHYRLLNEPFEAQSICLDILDVDPENQHALTTLLLAFTDRISRGFPQGAAQARELLPRLVDEYARAYYAGLISERQAKARLNQAGPGAGFDAYERLLEAMQFYETAESLSTPGNNDAVLRWNACARIIMNNKLVPRPAEGREPFLE